MTIFSCRWSNISETRRTIFASLPFSRRLYPIDNWQPKGARGTASWRQRSDGWESIQQKFAVWTLVLQNWYVIAYFDIPHVHISFITNSEIHLFNCWQSKCNKNAWRITQFLHFFLGDTCGLVGRKLRHPFGGWLLRFYERCRPVLMSFLHFAVVFN